MRSSCPQMFLVGYTVAQYRLDNYPMNNLQFHTGRRMEADVVATFLPGEVVESLYAAMRAAGLQVSSMTLEPIAAMNAAIPAELRLLNLDGHPPVVHLQLFRHLLPQAGEPAAAALSPSQRGWGCSTTAMWSHSMGTAPSCSATGCSPCGISC